MIYYLVHKCSLVSSERNSQRSYSDMTRQRRIIPVCDCCGCLVTRISVLMRSAALDSYWGYNMQYSAFRRAKPDLHDQIGINALILWKFFLLHLSFDSGQMGNSGLNDLCGLIVMVSSHCFMPTGRGHDVKLRLYRAVDEITAVLWRTPWQPPKCHMKSYNYMFICWTRVLYFSLFYTRYISPFGLVPYPLHCPKPSSFDHQAKFLRHDAVHHPVLSFEGGR